MRALPEAAFNAAASVAVIVAVVAAVGGARSPAGLRRGLTIRERYVNHRVAGARSQAVGRSRIAGTGAMHFPDFGACIAAVAGRPSRFPVSRACAKPALVRFSQDLAFETYASEEPQG